MQDKLQQSCREGYPKSQFTFSEESFVEKAAILQKKCLQTSPEELLTKRRGTQGFFGGYFVLFFFFSALKKLSYGIKIAWKMPDVYPARYPLIAICDPPDNRFSYVQERRQGGSEVGFGWR